MNLNEREKYWIQFYDAVNNHNYYNIAAGGNGGATYSKEMGYEVSKETREKIRNARLGKKASIATRLKFSKIRKGSGNPMYGKNHSEEALRKMSENRSIRIYTKKERRIISQRSSGDGNPMYGKNHSEEALKLMRNKKLGKNNPMYGREMSNKTKEKMSKARKGRFTRSKAYNARRVLCVETGKIYGCILDAQDTILKGFVIDCLRGSTKTAGGYHWEYA